ncbi:MAG: hypothetical protein AB8E15_08905 [Bdellovibrionales bacterium]
MANLKPILEELMTLKDSINKDSIREKVLSNFNDNRGKIETKLNSLVETTKNNPVVNEYVDQILKADLTNQAFDTLQTKFPEHEIVKKIVDLRKSLIEVEVTEEVESENINVDSEKSEEKKADSTEDVIEAVDAAVNEEEIGELVMEVAKEDKQ